MPVNPYNKLSSVKFGLDVFARLSKKHPKIYFVNLIVGEVNQLVLALTHISCSVDCEVGLETRNVNTEITYSEKNEKYTVKQ